MKKLYSLIRACMTSDMNLFKLKTKKGGKSSNKLLVIFIALYLMFLMWSNANIIFEKMAPMHLQFIVLSLAVFAISIMTIVEGVYKTGSLIFNCKDDQLLLSLPIKRRTVLFVRIFKFYVFELMFNSVFLLPIIIAYIRWAESIDWTFFLTNIVMLLMLPIIPIVISCAIGAIISGLSSRFKHKNIAQIVISMLFFLGLFYLSFNMNSFYEYIIKNATSVNDLITKIYYPAGIYATLITNFNIVDLLIFILVNIGLFTIGVLVLSKFYFKINSRLKKVTTTKKTSVNSLTIKRSSITKSLIKKELNTFFQTPVFIVNSGFGLVLFILGVVMISIKFDSLLVGLTDPNGMNMSKDLIMNNLSLVILILITVTAFMTSITNSVISLEGRSINILKSLPVKVKTILMSKVYSSLIITTPVFIIGTIVLIIRFKISIIESILLLILSVLIPLVSHFIGIIINLKYPKLDAENSTEVVKQSMSSFVSVMIGMILLIMSVIIIFNVAGTISSTLLLTLVTATYILINALLYLHLTHKGVKEFNSLSV